MSSRAGVVRCALSCGVAVGAATIQVGVGAVGHAVAAAHHAQSGIIAQEDLGKGNPRAAWRLYWN